MKIINVRWQIGSDSLTSVVNWSLSDLNAFLWSHVYKTFTPKVYPQINNQILNFAEIGAKLFMQMNFIEIVANKDKTT